MARRSQDDVSVVRIRNSTHVGRKFVMGISGTNMPFEYQRKWSGFTLIERVPS